LTEITDQQKYQILAKLSLMALYLVFGIDVTLAAFGYFIQGKTVIEPGGDMTLIRNIFLFMVFAEFASLHFVKNALLSKVPRVTDLEHVPYQQLLNITYVVAGMCVSIAVYGFLIVLLGGDYDFLLLFVAISLIGFQLFRLRKKDLDKIGT
jgi:hypothetical protein